MKINSTNVISNVLSFHIDWLEVYGTFRRNPYLRQKIHEITNDPFSFGSEEFELWDFTCDYRIWVWNYKSKLTFKKNGVACFAYYEWVQVSEIITTKDYFVVYGKALRILTLEQILEFIEANIEIQYLRRLDLALDIQYDIADVIAEFRELRQKGWQHFWDHGKLETYTIGDRNPVKNRNLFIRVYDKVAEIYADKLQKLYPEYLTWESVTRVELEFRPDLCKNLPFERLRDDEYLLDLFCRYIEKHTSLFQKLSTRKVDRLSRPKKKQNPSELHLIPKRYMSAFLGYARNIITMWWCPVDILLRNDIVRLSTVQDINRTLKKWRVSILSYKFWLEGEEIPEYYQKPEFQSPIYDSYTPPRDTGRRNTLPDDDMDIPF